MILQGNADCRVGGAEPFLFGKPPVGPSTAVRGAAAVERAAPAPRRGTSPTNFCAGDGLVPRAAGAVQRKPVHRLPPLLPAAHDARGGQVEPLRRLHPDGSYPTLRVLLLVPLSRTILALVTARTITLRAPPMTAGSAAVVGRSIIASRVQPMVGPTSNIAKKSVARVGGARGVPVVENSIRATGRGVRTMGGGGHNLGLASKAEVPAGDATLLALRARRPSFLASRIMSMDGATLSLGRRTGVSMVLDVVGACRIEPLTPTGISTMLELPQSVTSTSVIRLASPAIHSDLLRHRLPVIKAQVVITIRAGTRSAGRSITLPLLAGVPRR